MSLEELYAQYVRPLNVADKARLAAWLDEELETHSKDARPRWDGIRGALRHPTLGEDAQEWVSRTRRETDEQRRLIP